MTPELLFEYILAVGGGLMIIGFITLLIFISIGFKFGDRANHE